MIGLPAAMTRLFRAPICISQGKSRGGRSEFARCTRAFIMTPKPTRLFWHIQKVTEKEFDKAWSKFLQCVVQEPAMCCVLGLSSRDLCCAALLLSVSNPSSPLSLASQPRINHSAARQDHTCQPSFFPNAPPAHPW